MCLSAAGYTGATEPSFGCTEAAGCRTGDEPESEPILVRPTYIPLDEVPGLLCGGVVPRVIIQHFGDDLGHLLVQLK